MTDGARSGTLSSRDMSSDLQHVIKLRILRPAKKIIRARDRTRREHFPEPKLIHVIVPRGDSSPVALTTAEVLPSLNLLDTETCLFHELTAKMYRLSCITNLPV